MVTDFDDPMLHSSGYVEIRKYATTIRTSRRRMLERNGHYQFEHARDVMIRWLVRALKRKGILPVALPHVVRHDDPLSMYTIYTAWVRTVEPRDAEERAILMPIIASGRYVDSKDHDIIAYIRAVRYDYDGRPLRYTEMAGTQ